MDPVCEGAHRRMVQAPQGAHRRGRGHQHRWRHTSPACSFCCVAANRTRVTREIVSELRYAVAIHEAGHAIAFAAVGIDVTSVWIASGDKPSGRTVSGDFYGADRSDYL